ncbi:MAG: rhodanese-like domain-containing protein [Rhodospirillales bacterium]
MTVTNAKALTADAVRALILDRDNREVAVIDVRPGGTFGDAHLLWANSVPLTTLEIEILDRVPRLDTPVVLCGFDDADDGIVGRAAGKMAAMGYTDLAYLQGGVKAWEAAGFEVFSGVNVPSKAFGEFVEHTYDTPRIPATELKRMIDAGENMVVLDSRPMSEYHAMNIPTGVDVPGAELALRVHDLAPDPETTVVVNCAGRTRSIIGCQSLRNAGIPNKVVALENGTMGWHLAGFDLEYGNTRKYGEMTAAGLEKAIRCAEGVRARFGVRTVDAATLKGWLGETDRTTYVLDVRDPEEFAAGHVPGSRPAPGGQLVQATDRYVGTLGSRIVCVDDNGVRATMTASWLVQIGWDAVVLEPGAIGMTETGGHVPAMPPVPEVPTLEPTQLAARMIQTHVVDLGNSLSHRNAHIPGSRFAIRANMPENLAPLSNDRPIALTSKDGIIARFAAQDLIDAGFDREIVVLDGGTDAWKAAGLPVKGGFEGNLDASCDVWYRPYDMDDAQEGAMKQYLSWEVNLVAQIERDGTTSFRVFE